MKALVLRDFYDIEAQTIRRKGETFDANKKRIEELENSPFGKLAERMRKVEK